MLGKHYVFSTEKKNIWKKSEKIGKIGKKSRKKLVKKSGKGRKKVRLLSLCIGVHLFCT